MSIDYSRNSDNNRLRLLATLEMKKIINDISLEYNNII